MSQWTYLSLLLLSLSGVAIIDYKYKLALWLYPRKTIRVISIAMAVFIIWDIAGILLGIFFHGNSHYALSFRILPEFPIEELFFLLLLTYVSLIIYRFGASQWPRI
jgi:lycopene cyclase domain-containing protein